jgi:hypothetical protein
MDKNFIYLPKRHEWTSKKRKANPLSFESIEHGTARTTPKMELLTRYFPYTENDTYLFSQEATEDLKNLLDPIKERMMQEQLSDDELETCLAVCIGLILFTNSNIAYW